MGSVSVRDFDVDRDEIGRRKQLIRELWAGKPVDHVPIMITVTDPSSRYSIREQFTDADKQLEVAVRIPEIHVEFSILQTFRVFKTLKVYGTIRDFVREHTNHAHQG